MISRVPNLELFSSHEKYFASVGGPTLSRKAEREPHSTPDEAEDPLFTTQHYGNRDIRPPRRDSGSRIPPFTPEITSQARSRSTAHTTKHDHPHSRRPALLRQEEECRLG